MLVGRNSSEAMSLWTRRGTSLVGPTMVVSSCRQGTVQLTMSKAVGFGTEHHGLQGAGAGLRGVRTSRP
eukprot:scaffold4990_cov387-Prasinococcus_capsulatus_cf.AAC.25